MTSRTSSPALFDADGPSFGTALCGPGRLGTGWPRRAVLGGQRRPVRSLRAVASRERPPPTGIRRVGYDNLYLAGDWTDNGINAGCIEAAVVSGLRAANTVLGEPRWHGISGGWR